MGLWARHFILCLVLVQPRKTGIILPWMKKWWLGCKAWTKHVWFSYTKSEICQNNLARNQTTDLKILLNKLNCPWLALYQCCQNQKSRGMRFPTMWYVRPAKPQISLRICAVWSEPLLVAWISMNIKLLTEHRFEFLSLKRGCTGLLESTLVKVPNY